MHFTSKHWAATAAKAADCEGGGRGCTLAAAGYSTLDRPGYGVVLNRHGQVALNVRIEGGPTTLVLLTPAAL